MAYYKHKTTFSEKNILVPKYQSFFLKSKETVKKVKAYLGSYKYIYISLPHLANHHQHNFLKKKKILKNFYFQNAMIKVPRHHVGPLITRLFKTGNTKY